MLGTSLDFSQRVELLCQKHLQNKVGSERSLFDCPPHVMWEPSLPLLRGVTGRVPSSVAQPLEEIRQEVGGQRRSKPLGTYSANASLREPKYKAGPAGPSVYWRCFKEVLSNKQA